jgi:adenine C2-methylase RlmN of 23S rRNA A2503 and tRNA A37
LEAFTKEKKLQPFKVKQILFEIFKSQNINFDDMTTLSKELRQELNESFNVVPLKADKILEDKETTKI